MTITSEAQAAKLLELLRSYKENTDGLFRRNAYLQTSSTLNLVYFEIVDEDFGGVQQRGFIQENGEFGP